MYENLLEEAGLTRNESLVYLTLLKIGKSKSGKIVKEAGVSGGKIYETLYKLIDKGLVKVISEHNVKHFIANDPKTLLDYLKDKEALLHKKEKELAKVIPGLDKLRLKELKVETVSLIKGFKGIGAVVYDSLEKTEGGSVAMGVRSDKGEQFNNFWRKWHKERARLKKKCLLLFSDKNTDYWKFYQTLPYTEVREVLEFSPAAFTITGDHSFIFSYGEEFTCIHIHSKDIANSFRSFFDSLWKFAKKK